MKKRIVYMLVLLLLTGCSNTKPNIEKFIVDYMIENYKEEFKCITSVKDTNNNLYKLTLRDSKNREVLVHVTGYNNKDMGIRDNYKAIKFKETLYKQINNTELTDKKSNDSAVLYHILKNDIDKAISLEIDFTDYMSKNINTFSIYMSAINNIESNKQIQPQKKFKTYRTDNNKSLVFIINKDKETEEVTNTEDLGYIKITK